jgi:hypothetical protein
MLIYFLVILIVYCMSFVIEYKNPSNKWRALDLFVLLILIIFAGVRLDVGTDYRTYYNIYNNIVSNQFSITDFYATRQEFGYYLLSLLTKKISCSPYGIFITTAIITYIPIYSLLKKKSKNFPFSILLFFLLGVYTAPFNMIRQGIAISINFFASQYITNNRKKFILLNIIAASFHIVTLPVMFIQLVITKIKPTFKLVVGTLLLSAFTAVFYTKLTVIFSFLEKIDPRYIAYLGTNYCGTGLKLLIILRVMVILYVLLISKKTEYQYYKTSLIVSLLFMIIGMVNIPVARVASFFDIYLIILLPNILKTMARRERWLNQYCLIATFLIVFIFSLIFYGDLIPYKSYLF